MQPPQVIRPWTFIPDLAFTFPPLGSKRTNE